MNNVNELYSLNMSNLKAASVNQEYSGGILETPIFELFEPGHFELFDFSFSQDQREENVLTPKSKAQEFAQKFSYTTNIGEAVKQVTEAAFNFGFEKIGSSLSNSARLSDGAAATKKVRAMKRVK